LGNHFGPVSELFSRGGHWFIRLGESLCFFCGNDFSVEQMDGSVCETREPGIVSHHADGGSFAVQFVQQVHHGHAVLGIEIPGWFVGEEDRRAAGERSGDGDSLLLPAGKLRRVMAHAMRHAHLFESLFDSLISIGRSHATQCRSGIESNKEAK
jgi:hypothetical protein